MENGDKSSASGEPAAPESASEMPPGDHPLEVAARRGIGPLSPLVREVWHGHARPCVSCGHLVLREQRECDHCGQDLSLQMIEKMRLHAGPWDVFEHVRPFPGISLERVIRQIRRGVVTETSIVRGPATDFQWRFAIETPGLCRYFGKCWSCHAKVLPSETHCPDCLALLAFEKPKPVKESSPPEAPAEPHRKELRELSAAIDESLLARYDPLREEVPRIAGIRAVWLTVAVLIVAIATLLIIVKARDKETTPMEAVPGVVAPTGDIGH